MNKFLGYAKALLEEIKMVAPILAKSKTMQGIAAASIGTIITYAKSHLPAPILDIAGELITASAASLQAGGLAWAVRGRWVAAGPLSPSAPSAPPRDTASVGVVPK